MLSLLYLLVYLFAGCVIIRALLPAQRPQVRVWLGLSLGLLLLMWLPALLAFAVRFSLLGHMLALIPLAGITVAVWVTRDKTPARALDDKDRQLLILMACVAVPLTLLGGYLQYTHCLREFPFPEYPGEKFLGEDLVWIQMAEKYQMRFFNRVIYISGYSDDGLTKNRRKHNIASPRGCVARAEAFLNSNANLRAKLKAGLQYYIYGRFARMSWRELYAHAHNKFLFLILCVPAHMLYLRWKAVN